MNRWLAIVAYRCEVAGVPRDSLDIQVRYFAAESAEEVVSRIFDEPDAEYMNGDGELVTWPFVCVVAVEPFSEPADGDEVVGFIARTNEIVGWTKDDGSPDNQAASQADEG